MITPETAATYFEAYVAHYRAEHKRLTAATPEGGGYPSLTGSPYLEDDLLECLLARDGAVVADMLHEPDYDWHIAGGPGLVTDVPVSRQDPEVLGMVESAELKGKPVGLYRVVAKEGLSDETWHGELPASTGETWIRLDSGLRIVIRQYPILWAELIERLTFGALGPILDIHLPPPEADFWFPRIIRNLGFVPADRNSRRFFTYLELLRHVEPAAWDPRSALVRAHQDVRRDLASYVAEAHQPGGTISFGVAPEVGMQIRDSLRGLAEAIAGFEDILTYQSDGPESVFHEYLEDHPILLDMYGSAVSKPRFVFPANSTPLGKTHVEPDFVIVYPGGTYRLVELERPAKRISTKAGQPRAEVTQATFQIAEWKAYIAEHYSLIKDDFPGISTGYSSMIVIGRTSQRDISAAEDPDRYMALLRSTYDVDEIVTYDVLLNRSKAALNRLAAL